MVNPRSPIQLCNACCLCACAATSQQCRGGGLSQETEPDRAVPLFWGSRTEWRRRECHRGVAAVSRRMAPSFGSVADTNQNGSLLFLANICDIQTTCGIDDKVVSFAYLERALSVIN